MIIEVPCKEVPSIQGLSIIGTGGIEAVIYGVITACELRSSSLTKENYCIKHKLFQNKLVR